MKIEVVQDNQNKRSQRNIILIANFIDGYADGWRFAVRECFRDALDIKLTAKVTNKIEDYIWTQGTQFNFSQGDILYDTRLAYELTWGEALKHIKLSIQINEITPSKTVIFKLYRPNKERLIIEEVDRIECTQAAFVSFLQTGIITMSDNKNRNVFQEYDHH